MLNVMYVATKYIRWFLIISLVFFACAHLLAMSLEFNGASPAVRFWTRQFDLDQEYNVTSLYNWLILALAGAFSVILFIRQRSIWWVGLSILFIYLSLDEALLIHEQLAEPLRRDLALTNASPFFHAWVIPAIVLTMLLGMYLLIAAKKRLAVNFETNRIMYYVFLLALGSIIIEIVGTKTFSNIAFYRFVTVLVEEMYEMGFSSFILYQIILLLPRKADDLSE
jgi:hypothetical protein